jgi:hypothetical protein
VQLKPEEAWAEHLIPFDAHDGPTNADVAVVGAGVAGKIALVIEAKGDESFGALVGETFGAALERGIANRDSNGVRRIDDLARAIFRKRLPGQRGVIDLRYQLVTATAATIAFANQHGADVAVLIIHEFVTERTSDAAHRVNAADYELFLQRLSNAATQGREPMGLQLFHVPGGMLFPGGRSLLIGRVTTNCRQRERPR